MKRYLLLLIALVAGLAAWAQTFSVDNDANTFFIRRSGPNLPAQTVRYRTVSLSAFAGMNFTEASGMVNFAAGDTVKTITVQEATSPPDIYHFQTGTSRSYRFEVLDYCGFVLDGVDRSITYGTTYQHTSSYVNKSVTDLVYFDNSGSVRSGTGNKYLDVSYSSSSWVQVDDGGYNQAVHTVSTGNLFHGSSALRSYLNSQSNRVYATVYFQQKEEQDGYQYIQILADNATTMDGNDPNGKVNDPSTSLYKACFILSYDPSGSVMSDTHYQFFPHRYDHVDKEEETNAGITHYEFDYDNSHLYQQKYQNASYNAPNTGSLNLSTTVNNLNIRFDAAGSGGDNWDFKNLKVRLALVDATAPSLYPNDIKVSSGTNALGSTFYVSVPFSEIVTVSGTPTLTTSWGTIPCVGGSGSNVLTFGGEVDALEGSTLTVTSVNGTVTDLAGNAVTNKTFTAHFGNTVLPVYTITLPSSTPHGTVTSDKAMALIGETVTLTVTPDAGFALSSLTVTAGGNPVETTAGANNTYTFVALDNVTVAAVFEFSIDATNFPDAHFRNYLLAQDYGSDGVLTDAEIAGITAIDVLDKNIADLTGIEYFTAITYLDCSSNQLTALDVSHNTALRTLECNGNQLTTLDVSHNTALVEFDCNGNQLATLDISQNLALTQLSCSNNHLDALDLSGNTALNTLECHNNQLTALDVSHNTALRWLICYDNQINGENMAALVASLPTVEGGQNGEFNVVDLDSDTEQNLITTTQVTTARGKNWTVHCRHNAHSEEYDGSPEGLPIIATYFPDAYFRNWLLAQSYGRDRVLTDQEIAGITSINVQSKNIADLTGIEHFTALETLNCYENQLTALDVSHNTALTKLNCRSNQLTALDVSQNTALTYLFCYNNQLTTLDVSHNTALRSLSCFNNQINGENMAALVASLPTVSSGNGTFYVIDLDSDTEQNVITTSQVATARGKNWKVLGRTNGNWENYDCSADDMPIDEAHFPDAHFRNYLLAQDYGSDGVLTDAEIAGITAIDVLDKNIADLTGIEYFTAITYLDCSSNQLTALDVSHNTALTYLACGSNPLDSLDVSHNTALTSLQCFNSQLTALDLSHNSALSLIVCSDNQINAVNMEALVASLPTVSGGGAFYVINLDSETEQNVITATQVATARGKNWTVYGFTNGRPVEYGGSTDGLPIDSINFPDENFRSWLLEQDYGSDGLLTDAEIAGIKDMYVTYQSIADLTGIEHFTALTLLYCNGNQLTSLDVSHNTALRRLYCNNNQLTALDVSQNTALTILVLNNNRLTALDVSQNTALARLHSYNNQLTALDVSHNTALTNLDCSQNSLTSLDLSQNAALTYIECYNNQINGKNMAALVASLPTVDVENNSGRNGQFRVIDLASELEQNVITTTQVATARGKNWDVESCTNDAWWENYDGSEPGIPGDLNGDGMVDVGDVNIMINVVLEQITAADVAGNPDLDGSGNVDVADVNILINMVLSN